MGLLRISNQLIANEPDLVNMAIDFIERQHNGVIIRTLREIDTMLFEIDGDDIPDGFFEVDMHKVVKGVMAIRLVKI